MTVQNLMRLIDFKIKVLKVCSDLKAEDASKLLHALANELCPPEQEEPQPQAKPRRTPETRAVKALPPKRESERSAPRPLPKPTWGLPGKRPAPVQEAILGALQNGELMLSEVCKKLGKLKKNEHAVIQTAMSVLKKRGLVVQRVFRGPYSLA